MDKIFKSGIFISDMSHHFPVIFPSQLVKLLNKYETSYIHKRFVTDEAIADFNISLHQNNWKKILE